MRIARFEIPTRYFHDLILGAEMDLTVATYATFDGCRVIAIASRGQ